MEQILKVCELKVSYSSDIKQKDQPQITNSSDLFKVFIDNWGEDMRLRESVYVLVFNRNNRLQGMWLAGIGGISGCVIDVRTVMQTALLCNGSSIVIAHNHPTGNLNSSVSDEKICKKLKAAGETLDILLLDFIIVSDDGYTSYADEGKL